MKFVANILSESGEPLASGSATLVEATARATRELAQSEIRTGKLALNADPVTPWGLIIDGRPVLALARSATTKTVDLGDIVVLAKGVGLSLFHAKDGLVFGLPSELHALLRSPAQATRNATLPRASAALPGTTAAIATRITFGDAFGSTARQLGTALVAESGFTLSSANVTLKGLPNSTEDSIGLEFPDAELAKTGSGLSELSFTVKPIAKPSGPSAPSTPKMLDLTGYTPELAERKASALGFVIELRGQVVEKENLVGRVIRHTPKAGAVVDSSTVLRLYIGKLGAS